ncbi:MAG: alpha/beta hydrolase [Patescibacteria group bacterium]
MEIEIPIQHVDLKGVLELPGQDRGLVIFTHGSGSGRYSTRNSFVATQLQKIGLGTLLFDLLTDKEDKVVENRFDIELLTERLIAVTKWCIENEKIKGYQLGYFGASTGSAAALSAAAYWGTKIKAVVSRGGRPDLAMEVLDLIESPTLLIVGGEDAQVIGFNRLAYQKLGCIKKMEVVLGASHLSEEEGTMEKVADLSATWFSKYL